MNNKELQKISDLINNGKFQIAKKLTDKLLINIESLKLSRKNIIYIYNISGFYIDIGHLSKQTKICQTGLDLMNQYKKNLLKYIPKSQYYYNLANGKSNFITSSHIGELTFYNIEELIELKNLYWKSFKENQNEKIKNPQLLVNLANSLKRQYRVVESLRYYDDAIKIDKDIFQAQVNRSDSLKLLNKISNTYSAKLINEIKKGYEEAINSPHLPPDFIDSYKKKIESNQMILKSINFTKDVLDDIETKKEFDTLSEYRKYTIIEKLSLSEHGLYCPCIGAARDNLSIPLVSKAISGNFIPKMETILNRIKSEFSLARKNYYEYFNQEKDIDESLYENCFTELYNNELLGLPIEKLRTSFKLCFGILDKIALAINSLYELGIEDNLYFHNLWRLDKNNNREKFENIKNPGLLALYSISSDLNIHKNGEWAHFKDWRNALEHGMFIIVSSVKDNADPYQSLEINEKAVIIAIEDFIEFLKELLQLTRSAIFSFVFCVRSVALNTNSEGIEVRLQKQY